MTDYISDIPLSLAVSAFLGTSMDPDSRARAHRQDYADTMALDYEKLRQQAEKGGTLDMLDAEFGRYRAGYATRYRAFLSSHSRCISSFITGPSNFPVRRAEKRNAVADRRSRDLIEFRVSAMRAAIRNMRPDLRPIMAGDADAVDRLIAELATLESSQAKMKAINAAHKKFLRDPAIIEVLDLSDAERELIRTHKPRCSWEPHPFAPYEMTNNSANIRRVKARIEQLSTAKATPATEIERDGLRIEDCPADNRVRLFFDDKPTADIRGKLKSNGFRWSPSIGAWQAYRNTTSLRIAQEFAA